MEGLNVGILQKIFSQPTIPKRIDEWYEQASKYDAQYRRIREILGRCRGTSNTSQPKKTFTLRYTTTTRDPNAMDVDKMTVKEREQHMKENQCFNCHIIRHRAKDCHKKTQGNSSKGNTTSDEGKTNNRKSLIKYEGKKTANMAHALIRNLVSDMEKEEKDKLFKKTRIFRKATYLNVRLAYPLYRSFLCTCSEYGKYIINCQSAHW